MRDAITLILALLIIAVSSQQSPRGDITPPGAIAEFGAATGANDGCPSGWLLANGVAKSSTIYSKLDAAFGITWGARSGGNFQIPNLTGSNKFLRAAGGSIVVGSVGTDATKKNGLVASGGTASLTGTVTFASGHTHTAGSISAAIGAVDSTHYTLGYLASGVPGGAPSSTGAYSLNLTGHDPALPQGTHTFSHYTPTYGTSAGNSAAATVGISNTAASLSTGDSETRPVSTAVLYCIKY